MKLKKGIELLDERIGDGDIAIDGARVVFNARFFLRRGEEVTPLASSRLQPGQGISTRVVDGVALMDCETEIGSRNMIAGVERALKGMRVNGYREVVVAPHLAYGETGIPDRIPPNAILRIRLWLRDVLAPR